MTADTTKIKGSRIQDPSTFAGFSIDEKFIEFIEKYEDRERLPAGLGFYDFGGGYISVPEPYVEGKPEDMRVYTGRMMSALIRNPRDSASPDFLCFSYFPNSTNFGLSLAGAIGNFNHLCQKVNGLKPNRLEKGIIIRNWDIVLGG